MHSIHDIVGKINESLDLPQADIHGIAQTVLRKNNRDQDEKLPVVIGKKGEGLYVGFDDKKGIILYHKLNSVTTSIKVKTGYGDSKGEIQNSYAMSLIVFLNRKKVNIYADELFATIQSQYLEKVTLTPYNSISISFNNVILNDMQVYAQEYLIDTYRLTAEHNLFQINYTVEAAFNRDCFNTCDT
jgi:hypothetical protein